MYLGRMAGHYKGDQTSAIQKCLLFLCSDLSFNLPMYERNSGQCPGDMLGAMNLCDDCWFVNIRMWPEPSNHFHKALHGSEINAHKS